MKKNIEPHPANSDPQEKTLSYIRLLANEHICIYFWLKQNIDWLEQNDIDIIFIISYGNQVFFLYMPQHSTKYTGNS